MARFGQAIKKKVAAKLLPPNSASIEEVSREVGVSIAIVWGLIFRWAISCPRMDQNTKILQSLIKGYRT